MAIPTASSRHAARAGRATSRRPGRARGSGSSPTKAMAGLVDPRCLRAHRGLRALDRPVRPVAARDDLLQPPSPHTGSGPPTSARTSSPRSWSAPGVLVVGLLAGLLATVIAVIVGVTAGYLGDRRRGLSALSNVFLVIPALPLIIIIASPIRGARRRVALVIGFTAWAWGARLLRAQTLSLRRRDFVEAARATGERTWRIIGFEILPNLTAIIASGSSAP